VSTLTEATPAAASADAAPTREWRPPLYFASIRRAMAAAPISLPRRAVLWSINHRTGFIFGAHPVNVSKFLHRSAFLQIARVLAAEPSDKSRAVVLARIF
jgi:hypothetical protein